MPIIQTLNATNASFVMQYGKYTDFNLWLIIVVLSILLILASRVLSQRDDVGRLLVATLAVIFALVTVWGSLSVSYLNYTAGATITGNDTTNHSIIYNYVYPTQQVIASPWLTGVCIVLLIFSFLNAVDIFLVMMQRPSADDTKKKGGRGIRI
jgi:hypothetical protein